MFNDSNLVRLPVTLSLADGRTLNGCIILSRKQNLADALNRPEAFFDFEVRGGEAMVIAKTGIVSAAMLDERKARNGTVDLRKPSNLDPREVLGLPAGAPASAVRPAYLEKVKLYHPDQFSAHPLPPEVIDYLEAMFVRVKQAFEELSGQADRDAA